MSRNRKIVLLVIGALIVIGIVVVAFAALDVISYTATSSEIMTPEGTPLGTALVVYDPGLSGQAKQAANEMAKDLKQDGYIVVLAGVRSPAASNISGYDILIVGGPMYGGTVSGSIAEYLRGLEGHEGLRLGVFATTGSSLSDNNSYDTFKGNVASQVNASVLGGGLEVKLILTVDVEKDCAEFVSTLLE